MKNKHFFPFYAQSLHYLLPAWLAMPSLPLPGLRTFKWRLTRQARTARRSFRRLMISTSFFDVSGVDADTNFQSRWYAMDIEGEDPNVPFQTSDYTYESGISNTYFQLTNDAGWPTGNYKVEVHMNDVKVGEQAFSVQ